MPTNAKRLLLKWRLSKSNNANQQLKLSALQSCRESSKRWLSENLLKRRLVKQLKSRGKDRWLSRLIDNVNSRCSNRKQRDKDRPRLSLKE